MTTHTCTYLNISAITDKVTPRRCVFCDEPETIDSIIEWENKKIIQEIYGNEKSVSNLIKNAKG